MLGSLISRHAAMRARDGRVTRILSAHMVRVCERRMPGCARMGVISRVCIVLGYLVDPASSHMLVSKIKPCMSKYKRLYCETANGSLNQLWFI